MIDITPYQLRLELCKEWFCHKIDGTLPLIDFNYSEEKAYRIDLSVVPELSWDKVMDIYNQTGFMFWREATNMRQVTFEEYCKYKIKVK